jgi:hypothetical protein
MWALDGVTIRPINQFTGPYRAEASPKWRNWTPRSRVKTRFPDDKARGQRRAIVRRRGKLANGGTPKKQSAPRPRVLAVRPPATVAKEHSLLHRAGQLTRRSTPAIQQDNDTARNSNSYSGKGGGGERPNELTSCCPVPEPASAGSRGVAVESWRSWSTASGTSDRASPMSSTPEDDASSSRESNAVRCGRTWCPSTGAERLGAEEATGHFPRDPRVKRGPKPERSLARLDLFPSFCKTRK